MSWRQGVQDSIDKVKARLAHYESYRCSCGFRAGRPDDNIWHAPGCKAEYMETKPATFAALEEILLLLEAMLERGTAKATSDLQGST